MIYNNDMLPGVDYEEDLEPVSAGHDPTYAPRSQRDYNNELDNDRHFAPIDSPELDDLRADADELLPALLPRRRTTADAGDAPVPAPTRRRTPSTPPATTRLGRSVRPVSRLNPTMNQVYHVPTLKTVCIAPTPDEIESMHNLDPLAVHHSIKYFQELAPVFA